MLRGLGKVLHWLWSNSDQDEDKVRRGRSTTKKNHLPPADDTQELREVSWHQRHPVNTSIVEWFLCDSVDETERNKNRGSHIGVLMALDLGHVAVLSLGG